MAYLVFAIINPEKF
ncbi:potassium-transporting ATPase subunit F [Desulfotignum balticum]